MSGRHPRNQRNQNRGGRGHHRPNTPAPHIYAPKGGVLKITGLNKTLPVLDYGSASNNKPVEFLRQIGEHCAVTFKATISDTFLSIPPNFGEAEEEPLYPGFDPDEELTHTERAQIYMWLNDQKMWAAEAIKVRNDKLTAFSVVFRQLSEASRCEIEDDEGWAENFRLRDLLYLIIRIQATHIAVQSGNLQQDQERVRAKWYSMMMTSDQSSYHF